MRAVAAFDLRARGAALALAALAVLLPLPSRAADWVSLGGTSTTQGSVDRASITVEKKQLQAWAMFRFSAPQQSPGGDYRSQRSLSYFRCADRSIAYVEHVLYAGDDGGGEVVYTTTTPPAEIVFAKPEAGTMGARIVEYVCAEAAKKRTKPKG